MENLYAEGLKSMSLKAVKNKIRSIDKTRQVTKALQAVSAVKMRKSQAQAIVSRPYAEHALTILREVVGSFDGSSHALSRVRPARKICFVVVTSDRELAGSLNSLVLKAFMSEVDARSLKLADVGIVSVGKRGTVFFSKRGYHSIASYHGWGDGISFDHVEPLIQKITNLFEDGAYDEIVMIYTNFISTLTQRVMVQNVLPVTFEGVYEVVRSIIPESGKYSELKKRNSEDAEKTQQYIFEPSPEAVLHELIPMLLKIQVYHALLEANASEHSARMVAMKNASDNASDIVDRLRLAYNKVRQASITKEVSEIVGGTDALAAR